MKDYDKLSEEYLKAKAIADEISESLSKNKELGESELLTDFIGNDPVAGEIITSLTSEERHGEVADLLTSLDKRRDVKRLVHSLDDTSSDRHRKPGRTRSWTAAACVAVVVAISVSIWINSDTSHSETTAYIIADDEKKAVLTYSDGRFVVLDKEELTIGKDGLPLIGGDEAPAGESTPDQYTTLKIPRGGEFFITLPDGTQVWLNSETEMRFPTRYADNERRVRLKGEALFDVAKDAQKPFIVELGEGEVSVLGTRFNVTNYDVSHITAVLIEGSIAFAAETGESVILTPSQMASYDRASGRINIEEIDPLLYTSWIDNVFIFRRQTLEEIMQRLARWYDIDVVFESENARRILLSGQIRRDEDLDAVLRIYENSTDAKFRLRDKTLTISTK